MKSFHPVGYKRVDAFNIAKFLNIVIILALSLSCSTTKGPYTYEICVRQDADTSKIIEVEMIGNADTTAAFLSGKVLDLESKEALLYANVSLKGKETK